MFNLAVKDSFRFAKNNCIVFCSIVLVFVLVNCIDFGYSLRDMSVNEFAETEGAFLYIHMLLIAFLWLGLLSSFEIFKNNKKITISSFFKSYKRGFIPILTYAISLTVFITLIGLLFIFLIAIDFIVEIKIYEIFNYLAVESGVLLLIFSIFIMSYIIFKLYFGLVFAFIDSDHLIFKSISKSFSSITYKDIIKLSIAILAYLFVVVSVGKFCTEILEMIMRAQSIDYFKLGQFNLFAFFYLFIKSSVCILSCVFVTSYAWMYHQKLHASS